jgi:hypothetical protein
MPAVADHALGSAASLSWYVRTLLLEVRSLSHRIRILSRKRNRPDPIDLGPMYEVGPDGATVLCKATFARTKYIEFLLARFPWVTDADILLALDGWDKASKGMLRSEDTERMDEVATSEQYHLTLGG